MGNSEEGFECCAMHNIVARQTFVNRMVLSVKVIQFIFFLLPSGSGILGVKQRNP